MLAGLDLVFRKISKFLKEILGLLNQKNFLAQEKPIRTSNKGQKKILETFDILSKKSGLMLGWMLKELFLNGSNCWQQMSISVL